MILTTKMPYNVLIARTLGDEFLHTEVAWLGRVWSGLGAIA